MTIIDGKAIAERLQDRVGQDIAAFRREVGPPVGLATILVGDASASESCVGSKCRLSVKAGGPRGIGSSTD